MSTESKQNYVDLLAALLVLILPFSMAIPNILLIPLSLIILVNYRNFTWTKSLPIIFFTIAVILLILLGTFNQGFLDKTDLYTKYLLVPLLFLLFTQVKSKKYCEYAFLVGVFTAMTISCFFIGNQLLQNPEFALDYGAVVNKTLLLERPYFAFMLVLGIFICLKKSENSKRKFYYYLLALIFAGFIIYISARLAIALTVFLFFVHLFKTKLVRRKTKMGIGIGMLLLFAIALGTSDNLRSRLHIQKDWGKTLAYIQDYEPRLVIWPCAIRIAQQDGILLSGLKSYDEVEKQLTQCYAESIEKKGKRAYYLDAKFNTHNQFLGFLLLGGVIPALLLLITFLCPWFSNTPFEFKLILFLFFAFFFVENVLHRQLGCYLFGIFTALYSPKNHE